jgi:hypothetical protein
MAQDEYEGDGRTNDVEVGSSEPSRGSDSFDDLFERQKGEGCELQLMG